MKKEEFDQKINFIVYSGNNHKNREGKTVYSYAYNPFRDVYHFQQKVENFFKNGKQLPTGNSHIFDFYDVENLINISYCEGDVYVLFFDSINDLKNSVKSAMQFYAENEEYQYHFTVDEFLNRQINS